MLCAEVVDRVCPISEFWCQALWGHCQVIPGEEESSPVDTPPRPKACLQEMQDRVAAKGGGYWRGHIGSAEEKKVIATGCGFSDSQVNNMM